jgi:hypothetical protein
MGVDGSPQALSASKDPRRAAKIERREPPRRRAENRQYSIARFAPNFDPPIPPVWVVGRYESRRLFDDPKRVMMS